MRILVQRVKHANVTIDGEIVGKINQGLLIFLGIADTDIDDDINFLADKCANLRIFSDTEGKMNLSLLDTGGEALVISQFTLYGDAAKGRRPSFIGAARPDFAIPVYEKFVEKLAEHGIPVATGEFGADMDVNLCNDGPVTIWVESERGKNNVTS